VATPFSPPAASRPHALGDAFIANATMSPEPCKLICRNSLYASEEELRQGFITDRRPSHRHRRQPSDGGRVKTLKNISARHTVAVKSAAPRRGYAYAVNGACRVFNSLSLAARCGKSPACVNGPQLSTA
jgi:hypothetical protein